MAGVIDLATYAYKLELNDKDFTSKMQSAKGSTENLKGKLGGLTSFLKGAVIGGLQAAGGYSRYNCGRGKGHSRS